MFIPDDPILKKQELGDSFVEDSFIPDVPDTIVPKKEPGVLENLSTGVAKAELKTVKGLGTFGQYLLDQTAGRLVHAVAGKGFTPTTEDGSASDFYRNDSEKSNQVDALLTPEGTAQNIGYGLERVAEFLLPAKAITSTAATAGTFVKSLTMGKTASKGLSIAADLGIKGVIEGISSGFLTALQRNKVDNEAKIAALIGFAAPTVAAGVSKLGEKMLNANIKPSQADMKNGFKMESVKKYDVGGSLSTSLKKTASKISDAGALLDEKLANSKIKVNVQKAIDETVTQLRDKKSLVFGQVKDVNGGIDELLSDITDLQQAYSYGELKDMSAVPIQIANNQIKRGAGLKGSWVYGRIDKNADAIDKVYSVFYSKLKEEINRVGPKGIESLNKIMSDLIPVQSALIRRIPVAERNNIIGLGENMAIVSAIFDPRALYLLLPQVAQKSGTFANWLMKVSENGVGKTASTALKTLNTLR